MAGKQTKVIVRRRKFLEVEIPVIRSKIELIGNSPEELQGRTIKLDLTRQLKGKSVEAVVKIKLEDKKLIATPEKIKLMPYFIRRMIRKKISYVEDSFLTLSQENMLLIKPFLITRKRVSRAVRKTLRNKCRNYLQDYIAEKTNAELFNEILTNKLQKSLSLYLKKTYPLSLCEIRILEIKRPLNPEEVPKIKPKPIEEKKKIPEEEIIDQLAEIEQERIKKAEKEIKQTQEIAAKIEEKQKDNKEKEPKKRGRKKESKNKEE